MMPAAMTKGPNATCGMRPPSEMKKASARAVKELRARERWLVSTAAPKIRSGAMEIETNSRPSRAALAPVLATRKLPYSDGTTAPSLDRVFDHGRQGGDEIRARVEGPGAPELDPPPAGEVDGLDVDVVEDLEVVGHKADRADQDAPRLSRAQALQEAGAEPRLAGLARGLERELPGRDRCRLRDQPAALGQALGIGVAFADREAVRREDDDLGVEIAARLRWRCSAPSGARAPRLKAACLPGCA